MIRAFTMVSVPMATLPVLITTEQHAEDTDHTWFAVTPAIWQQIALNLSMMTACIPSLKSILDSLLGDTAGAAIRAPYELRGDIGGRLRATALNPATQVGWVELVPTRTSRGNIHGAPTQWLDAGVPRCEETPQDRGGFEGQSSQNVE